MPKLDETEETVYWHVIKWKKYRYGTNAGMPLMKDDMRFRCFDKAIALDVYRNAVNELIVETVQGWRPDIEQCGVVFAFVRLNTDDNRLTKVMSFAIGGDTDVQIPDCESRNPDNEGQDNEKRQSKTWHYPSGH